MARIQWQRFEWTSGADLYTFAVTDNGLFGTLTAGDTRKVTLPMVAWEGMLDSVALARKGKSQSDRPQPDRSGARWSDPEVARLEQAFRGGAGIPALARMHQRSRDAVEAQLEKLGLWNRFERRPVSEAPPFPSPPGDWPYPSEPGEARDTREDVVDSGAGVR